MAKPDITVPQRSLKPSDYEFAHVWAEKIGLQIVYGNEEAAIDLVKLAMIERRPKKAPAVLLTPLIDILDACTANLLDNHADVITVGDLLNLTPERLLAIPMLREVRMNTIYASLAAFAFQRLAEAG